MPRPPGQLKPTCSIPSSPLHGPCTASAGTTLDPRLRAKPSRFGLLLARTTFTEYLCSFEGRLFDGLGTYAISSPRERAQKRAQVFSKGAFWACRSTTHFAHVSRWRSGLFGVIRGFSALSERAQVLREATSILKMVPGRGLEPRCFWHRLLRPACLPIPPPGQTGGRATHPAIPQVASLDLHQRPLGFRQEAGWLGASTGRTVVVCCSPGLCPAHAVPHRLPIHP